MNSIVSITSQGQLTIPKSFRDIYGIHDEAKALITYTSDGIVVKPYTRTSFWKLKGSVKTPSGKKMSLKRKIAEESKSFEEAIATRVVSSI